VARPQFVDTGTGLEYGLGIFAVDLGTTSTEATFRRSRRKLVPIAISDIGAHAQGLSPGTGHTHRLNTKNMA
jgi:hypothetical protein